MKQIFVVAFLALIMVGFVHGYFDSGYTSSAYYSAMFDERGLASVGFRLDYTHASAQPTDHINLNIQGTEVKVVSAFVRGKCDSVKPVPVYDYPDEYYQKGCQYDGYRFAPAKIIKIGEGSYRVMLNQTLAYGESTNLVVFYRAFGYVNNGIFGKEFAFQSIRNDFDVENTRVSIEVEDGLILKEGGGKGNYNKGVMSELLAPNAASAISADSVKVQGQLSSAYSSISYASGYVKEKSVLLAGETFSVKGTFADSLIVLYAPEGIIVLLVAAGGLWYLNRENKKQKLQEAKEKQGKVEKAMVTPGSLTDLIVFSFMGAVLFALASAIIYVGISSLMLRQDIAIKTGTMLLAWVFSMGIIYTRKRSEGNGVKAVLLFVGFSILITPFALLVAAIITNMLFSQVYPVYY
ncbi:hypothetical protein HY988_01725 [Candidatus Micrarchaeota archaeon]|nr:hypothetical protein [Candidatus Micrarchaeota archaeon]